MNAIILMLYGEAIFLFLLVALTALSARREQETQHTATAMRKRAVRVVRHRMLAPRHAI